MLHRLVEPVLGLDQLAPPVEPASRRRNAALTARSMPTVWTRTPRDRGASWRRIWSSLPTWPSVTRTSTRSRIGCLTQQAGRLAQRREHLGAAASVQAGQELDGAEPVAVVGRHEPGRQRRRRVDLVVEGQHREPVGATERVDDPGGRAPRGDHLPAAHAARPVEHQHHVPAAGRRLERGRQHGQRERAALVVGQHRQRGADRARCRIAGAGGSRGRPARPGSAGPAAPSARPRSPWRAGSTRSR